LSPACASYDQFRNFVERGHLFKQLVVALDA
jgi:UDP-N-acetylmuramoylalanine-D-glutamate ligase